MTRKTLTTGLFLVLFSATLLFGQNSFVPDDLSLGGGLEEMMEAFYNASSLPQQIIIVKMMDSVDSDEKYEYLRNILMEDLKGAELYGQVNNTAPEARKIAAESLAATGDIAYIDDYLYILQYDSDLDVRLAAAEAIGLIKDDSVVPVLVTLLETTYNHPDFSEADDDMYNDDLVCEGIITAMGIHGNPKYFTALLDVVTLRNHRSETIAAAWDAMALLQW